jgi:hypothetical protein
LIEFDNYLGEKVYGSNVITLIKKAKRNSNRLWRKSKNNNNI